MALSISFLLMKRDSARERCRKRHPQPKWVSTNVWNSLPKPSRDVSLAMSASPYATRAFAVLVQVTAMASVRLQSVSKKFGQTVVVDDVTLDIADREFLVLVGPSGCGKSTTLRMIAGLETASGGDIFIGDRRVNDLGPKDRDIAMVFQNYALYPHMNVYDNMAFGLKMRKLPRAEIDQRVTEAADILGLGPLLKRKPKEMSGGQRQRAALGRAIVRHPAVFLMDEPLSNLDAKLRVQTRTED